MFKTVRDFDVTGKRILVRCDFNVPLDGQGNIIDDRKIKEALPTLQYLLDHGAGKIIIITHLGDGHELLNPIVARFNELLSSDRITVLENIRSHKEEIENDEAFAKKLSELGDIYINEAFDVCHRAHASVIGIPKFLPHGAGFALEKEVQVLSNIMQSPTRPMIAIIGGAKATTKAKFVEPFTAFADLVIISGLIKKEIISEKMRFEYPEKILGPKDNLEALDLADTDIARITKQILQAKTIFWNGPFGKFEDEEYKKGTLEIAKAIIASKAFSVVGGGETVEFLEKEGMLDKFSHVSTAGGAMLSYLAGEEMPGLKALEI